MTTGAYVVGVDFGTASGRAVLIDCADGRELASASSDRLFDKLPRESR